MCWPFSRNFGFAFLAKRTSITEPKNSVSTNNNNQRSNNYDYYNKYYWPLASSDTNRSYWRQINPSKKLYWCWQQSNKKTVPRKHSISQTTWQTATVSIKKSPQSKASNSMPCPSTLVWSTSLCTIDVCNMQRSTEQFQISFFLCRNQHRHYWYRDTLQTLLVVLLNIKKAKEFSR